MYIFWLLWGWTELKNRGKNIDVFLMDGDAEGRIKASIANWIGVIYKIPRNRLNLCKEDVFSQSSVYFLFDDSEHPGKKAAYIGQAGIRKNGGGILSRLQEHDKNPDKDYWTDAIVLTTATNSFGPTELNFLESYFCEEAIKADRYDVKNANDPTKANTTEEKKSELEDIADYTELILGVLGYRIFEPVKSEPTYVTTVKNGNDIKIKKNAKKPSLPDHDIKIGEYVRKTMHNLSDSGYAFSRKEIDEMCTPEWSKEHFHTQQPFMKRCNSDKVENKDSDGKYVRFWKDVFEFGDAKVLVSKEWYARQQKAFDSWYLML